MSFHGVDSHICGFYYVVPTPATPETPTRQYLPQLSLSAHAKIIVSAARTTLSQTFVNPKSEPISELRYTFPLYDGVSVVGFVCTVNGDRVIRGVVKERAEARKTYKEAVDRGETAGLLEQLPAASDVFTTTVGNIPAGATLKVDITYLGELKHDAEVDGIRFTIPTQIAPRYGSYPGQLLSSSAVDTKGGINIVVDAEMPDGCNIKKVQSPSHPISVTIGNTSTGAASGADMSLQKASATLALSTAELGADFVLQVVATNTGNPVAVLETHPTIPNHRALMATLVPRFSVMASRPEVVFLCDRSGSMEDGKKIPNLKTALQVFLKSLPVGVKFNICSFGSRYEFLFPQSRTYDEAALEDATRYVKDFDANFGGTDIYGPMLETFKRRYTDMDLEVFLLTDGEIWDQAVLIDLLNKHVEESNGAIRVFTLGIGSTVSHSLIEGVANAGNGFSQTVGEDENMNSKVVRMLKASLMLHVKDYTLEVQYHDAQGAKTDDDFELVEKVVDAMTLEPRGTEAAPEESPKKPISLFDESADPDVEMLDASLDTSAGGKYSHVPPVSEPKILQAPFIIPPLFPFNRTTVFLLLSPETIQKQPKSIILRGTCGSNPIEQEIPVTVLSEKGETIHQLAARKAVKELEEGRGWIYHAKETTKGDAMLLKEKYPGRFPDMVEREAVRLGVAYQVGGKWCSFVAVEANQEVSTAVEQPDSPPEPQDTLFSTGMSAFQFASPGGAPIMSSMRHRLVKRSSTPEDTGFSGLFDFDSSPPMQPQSSQAPLFSTDAFGRAQSAATPAYGMMNALPKPTAPPALFGSAAPAPAAAVPNPMEMGMRGAVLQDALPDVSSFPLPSTSDDEWEEELATTSHPPPPPPPAAAFAAAAIAHPGPSAESAPDKLNELVALQSFSGAWPWTDRLLLLLGLDKDLVPAKAMAFHLGGASDALATALVLVYLDTKLQSRKDEWELLAEKAQGWLRVALVNGGVLPLETYLAQVKQLLMLVSVIH